MKKRFKEALFAFFREEILKTTAYKGVTETVVVVSKELKFTELKARIVLDNSLDYGMPINRVYEDSLNECKREMFEKVMRMIEVNERSLMDSHVRNRAIEVSLFIGQKNK